MLERELRELPELLQGLRELRGLRGSTRDGLQALGDQDQEMGQKPRQNQIQSADLPAGRMLKIEHKGSRYDWFDLEELGDTVRTVAFCKKLCDNIAHYFGIPCNYQAVFDEEGLLLANMDFARALRSSRPWLRVCDLRELAPDLKEELAKQLQSVTGAVRQLQLKLGVSDVHAPQAPSTASEVLLQPILSHQSAQMPFHRNQERPDSPTRVPRDPNQQSQQLTVYGTCGKALAQLMAKAHADASQTPASSPELRQSTSTRSATPVRQPGSPTRSQLSPAGGSMAPVPVPVPSQPLSWAPSATPETVPSQLAPWPDVMLDADVTEVLLSKDSAVDDPLQRFGFSNVPSRDGKGLVISSMEKGGLLAKWNRSYPDKAVLEGDHIISVNNVRADVDAMRIALYSDTVRMVVHRLSSLCSPSLQQRAALPRPPRGAITHNRESFLNWHTGLRDAEG